MEANRVNDIDNINQKGRGNENMEHKISCGSHDLRRNDQTCIIQVIIIGERGGGVDLRGVIGESGYLHSGLGTSEEGRTAHLKPAAL